MNWLLENIWMLLSLFLVATFIYSVYKHRQKQKEQEGTINGTLHCPYCGSTIGSSRDGESVLDAYFVEDGKDDEGELPDNVIPFVPRAKPIFVSDDPDDVA